MEIQDRAAKMTVRILLDQDSDQTIFDDGTTVIKTCAALLIEVRSRSIFLI